MKHTSETLQTLGMKVSDADNIMTWKNQHLI